MKRTIIYSSVFYLAYCSLHNHTPLHFISPPFYSNKLYLLQPILLSPFYLYPHKYSFYLFRISFPLSFETLSVSGNATGSCFAVIALLTLFLIESLICSFNYIAKDLPTNWFGTWIHSLGDRPKCGRWKTSNAGEKSKQNNMEFLRILF